MHHRQSVGVGNSTPGIVGYASRVGRSHRLRAERVDRVAPVTPPAPAPARPALLVVATVASTIGAFLAPFAVHLRSHGWRVDAAASGVARDLRVASAFDELHEVPLSRSLRDVRGLARARRALLRALETAPDIVHVHTPIASFLTRLLIRQMPPERRPAVVYTAHGFHFRSGGRALLNAVFLTAERIAGRWTDRLVVINDEDEEAARRHRIVADRRLVRMPGIGLDTEHYSPSAVPSESTARFREDLGIAIGAPLFTIVGELNRNKRQADAIAALATVPDLEVHLVLAGEGPAQSALEAQARAAGLEGRVHFLGLVADVRPVVRAATAVLLLSTREGLARSVMEALSLEVPVIASTARGNRELVGEDRGMVIQTGDVPGLAAAMTWMIAHPDERRRMGERGRARMVERYDLPLVIRMHEDLYSELLAERDRS
jgi:glycosyltransferase involved in cell wall biosynthesis